MIRGAFILAVGFALGYGHAMSQMPEIREGIAAVKREWAQADAEADHNDTEGETPQ